MDTAVSRYVKPSYRAPRFAHQCVDSVSNLNSRFSAWYQLSCARVTPNQGLPHRVAATLGLGRSDVEGTRLWAAKGLGAVPTTLTAKFRAPCW